MNLKGFFSKHLRTIHFSWRRVWVGVMIFVVLLALIGVGSVVYAHSYEDKVLPGVYLGDIHIGGMEASDLKEYIQSMHDKLSDQGVEFRFVKESGPETFIVYPSIVNEEFVKEIISVDIDEEVKYLLSYRKNGNVFADIFSALWVRMASPHIGLHAVKLDKDAMLEEVYRELEDYISEPVNASVHISSVVPLSYDITTSSSGMSFDYEHTASKIVRTWAVLERSEILIESFEKNPDIVVEDVEQVIDRLPSVFEHGRLDILYTDPHTKQDFTWFVSLKEMASWLEVQKTEDDNTVFALSNDNVIVFLNDDIASFVNVEPRDAKFQIGTYGKVTEFQGSRPGVGVDVDETYRLINEAIIGRTLHDDGITKTITLVTEQVEPNVKTGEINDLGISEILGIGHSKFRGSPSNRIKNIKHAAYDKLHGLLIKPGEEFSLVQALMPFTIADGYLPELVIKGDRITPELGGGLCQIGTTMFRTAMNSGLKITERRNHSLVVPYYNDLSNGNPGTDATIYEPHPDFRFLNDTDHHVLITTEINVATADLYFYFWGTSDGRKGYYSAPYVSKWIPVGEERIIETDELEPGEKECQEAHTGAVASFVYTRVLPEEGKVDRVFDSYYRPLPRICLVGIDKDSKENICPEGKICDDLTGLPDDTADEDDPGEQISQENKNEENS